MSFSFLGAGGGGGGGSLMRSIVGQVAGSDPDPNRYIQIWDPNNPSMPEPDIAHVFYYGGTGWMNMHNTPDRENYPPACGGAFGYKRFYKGDMPHQLFAWIGGLDDVYPYTYANNHMFGGFNIGPSRTDAWELPTPTRQGFFHRTDYLAPDVVGHAKGDWDKVFKGGDGHFFERTLPITSPDGPGSNGSVFGPGYSGDVYPGGTGGPGTATARGPVATHIADGIADELGMFKRFVKGKAQSTVTHSDNGEVVVDLPSDMFVFSAAPIDADKSLFKLPVGPTPTARDLINSYYGGFGVILQYL